MRAKIFSITALLLLVMVSVPMFTGCSAVASYLLYEWIENEFDNDDEDREEPLITKITIDKEIVNPGDAVLLEVDAEDDQDSASDLEYLWVVSAGELANATSRITLWTAPDTAMDVTVSIVVTDTDSNQDSAAVVIPVGY